MLALFLVIICVWHPTARAMSSVSTTMKKYVIGALSEHYIYPNLRSPDKWKFLRALHLMNYEPFNQVNDAWNSCGNQTAIEPLTYYLTQTNQNDQYKQNVLLLTEYFLPKTEIAHPTSKMCILLQYGAADDHWYWIEWILSHYQIRFDSEITSLVRTTSVVLLHGATLNDNLDILQLLLNKTNIDISSTDAYVCFCLYISSFTNLLNTCTFIQQRNALFHAIERMNIPIISYLIDNGINVNQEGYVIVTSQVLWYRIILNDTGYEHRRRANIIEYAIYLWMVERDNLDKKERREIVKRLLMKHNPDITNYVHRNLNKYIFHIRRNAYSYQSYKIGQALKDMEIDPVSFQDLGLTWKTVCCFQ